MKKFLILVFLILSCSTQKEILKDADSFEADFHLVFSSGHHLSLEPCGCSISPRGGIIREWNYLQELNQRKNGKLIFMTSGISFNNPTESKLIFEQKLLKAETLVEAWNQMGLSVMGIDPSDLELGWEAIKQLKTKSKFEWIASNIRLDKPEISYWKSFAEWNHPKVNMLILSLSKPHQIKNKKISVMYLDPIVVTKSILKNNPKPSRMVIVLSSLDKTQEDKLIREVPEVNILSRGEGEPLFSVEQKDKAFLLVASESESKSMTQIDLKFNEDTKGFYNPLISDLYKQSNSPIKNKIPKDFDRTLIEYRTSIIRLNHKYEKEGEVENHPMQLLIDTYRNKTHQLNQ